jgi:hypothetical protein
MHKPLSLEARMHNRPNAASALLWIFAIATIVAVAFVGIALLAGELSARGPDQSAGASMRTVARSAAPSDNDLFTGMPLP